jgi:cytochrome c5
MKVRHLFSMLLICLTVASVALAGGHESAAPSEAAPATAPSETTPATAASETAPSGQAVFEASCANCHDSFMGGLFTGAPAIGDADDWVALTPKGVDGLTGTTIAGIGKMDARGGCVTCTDEEIRAAVAYMLEQNQ